MTQPDYTPIAEEDKVRPAYRLRTPAPWKQTRVAELKLPGQPTGPELGTPGPDQGYALLLADELFSDDLRLSPGISIKDATVGCAAVACARSARYGRAPVAKDLELALVLFGFLGDPPADLVEWRTPLFQGASHHYESQRRIVDSVHEDTLEMTPDELRGRLADWRSLLTTS
jgi:hypothetical protein